MRFIVEVWSDNNNPLSFPPLTGERLRARWITTNIRRPPHESVAQMPVIPGMRLMVDTDRRVVAKFDPLAHTPEGRKAWEEVCRKKDAYRQHLGIKMRVEDQVMSRANCSDDELKTWTYWVRRCMDIKDPVTQAPKPGLRHIEGDAVPSLEMIAKMPGKTEVGQNNILTPKKVYREDLPQYAAAQPLTPSLLDGIAGLSSSGGLAGGDFGGGGFSGLGGPTGSDFGVGGTFTGLPAALAVAPAAAAVGGLFTGEPATTQAAPAPIQQHRKHEPKHEPKPETNGGTPAPQ